jgi:integrase
MSEDMRELCTEYHARAGERTWFFEYNGKPYSTKWMTSRFHHCWKNSGLQAHGTPRPYDLRHAFASHNLMRWIDQKLDVMALLPFLSSYMGHSELTSTLYYVHLLPDRLRKSSGIDWTRFSDIYGKAGDPDEA